ncbi:hypothetical protein GLOIN_2v1549788 [Rhizophagus irregularis DAOM 181602=DAOM 197198]|nr:hypothetical protein GLOIN_2v1549788 [Rhizophagus irregularis DAOM 181602=DAOM 197198]
MSSYSSLSRVLSPFRVQTKFEENSLPASPALNPKRYTEIMLEQPPSEHIHILVQLPTPATTGPSHQGVPQVTSIEDAMKKILEGIHKQMDVDNVDNNKPKPMALKQRDLKQAIDVIDRNFCNSLDKQKAIKKETPTAKTNYRILLCGGAPGIGKTRGLPRALEYLFAEFFGQDFTRVKEFFEDLEKKKLIPSTIYTSVSKDIDTAYKIKPYAREHKMLIYELVYRNIMEIESDISDVLQDGDHRIKLEHLERDKHLILRRLEEKDKVQIDIPYFFMYHYASVLGVFTEHLNHAFLPDEIWSWQNWEKFIADFITSRINMIDVLNKEKLLKLGNFFRGSGSNVTLGQLINFGSVEIYELNHQFPCLNLSAKEGKTAVLKPGYIMINGYSAPFADIFFLVDEPDPILIAIQCRLRKNLLNLKTIEDEHKRNANISHKMEEKARKLKNDSKIASREKKEELRKEAEKYTQLGNLLI